MLKLSVVIIEAEGDISIEDLKVGVVINEVNDINSLENSSCDVIEALPVCLEELAFSEEEEIEMYVEVSLL